MDPRKLHLKLKLLQRNAIKERKFLLAYNWEKLIENFLARMGFDSKIIKNYINSFFEYVHKFASDVELIPDALQFLKKAKESENEIFIVSNAYKIYIDIPLKVLKLDRYIDMVITPDVVAKNKRFRPWIDPIKPFRPIFIFAILHASYDELIYIGDNPIIDGIGAARAGIPTVYIVTEKKYINLYDADFYALPSIIASDGLIDKSYLNNIVYTSWKKIIAEQLYKS